MTSYKYVWVLLITEDSPSRDLHLRVNVTECSNIIGRTRQMLMQWNKHVWSLFLHNLPDFSINRIENVPLNIPLLTLDFSKQNGLSVKLSNIITSPRHIYVGLPRLQVWTEAFCVYAINVYKTGLPFKRTLACDELHALLIASSNVKLI